MAAPSNFLSAVSHSAAAKATPKCKLSAMSFRRDGDGWRSDMLRDTVAVLLSDGEREDMPERSDKGQSEGLAANLGCSQLCHGDSQLEKTTRGKKRV